jgi:hypothetical protein
VGLVVGLEVDDRRHVPGLAWDQCTYLVILYTTVDGLSKDDLTRLDPDSEETPDMLQVAPNGGGPKYPKCLGSNPRSID